MRITRDSLMSLTRDFAETRFRESRDLVCIYMTGSMRLQFPLLGGATDIDLVFVHIKEPAEDREVVGINADVSFDITHLSQSVFEQPRQLRISPWLGSFLCENPVLLKENKHWFEFTQAAVCAQFNAPEMVLARVKPLAESARRRWFSLQKAHSRPAAADVRAYLDGVADAVNACACLYGSPLTDRRFFLDFSEISERENQQALSILAKSLICDLPLPDKFWVENMPVWRETLASVGKMETCPKVICPARHNYYVKACETLQAEHPAAALWIMLRTWVLAEEKKPDSKIWDQLLSQSGFDASGLEAKLDSLDKFLDIIDELFENWARYNGL